MRLRSITLANFKSFADEAEIPIDRITCIIGPNGAGKSNAIYGLERVAAILSGEDYRPKKSDYFDDNGAVEMRLSATIELSDDEQKTLLDRPKMEPDKALNEKLVGSPLFRRVKYAVSFQNDPEQKQEEVWLSDANGDLQLFIRARARKNKCDVHHRNIEEVDMKNLNRTPLSPRDQHGPLGMSELFGMLGHPLFDSMQETFAGIRIIPTDRAVLPSVPARQSDDVGRNGRNLPNEIYNLLRARQGEFDSLMSLVTHDDPRGVEPRPSGTDLILVAREDGLTRNTPHAELGTGQIQTLVLGIQMFGGSGAVFVVKEPELHLHAERQRQVLRLIRDRNREDGTQFVIETHSPAFLGAGPGERVILVTKDRGRSKTAEIGPDNVDLIRREMGITYTDALSPANILFAEGPSDIAAFGPFLGAVAPGHAISTMVYSLDGAHNTKNLGMLIRYLKTEGRRMFVILDENDRAKRQVEELERGGLLDGNYHFLDKDLEDEFDSGVVAKAACEMAAEAGHSLALTAADLDKSRARRKGMATALKNAWERGKCGPFSKVKLAEHMVRLSGNKVPPGIREALVAAVAHFEEDAGDDAVRVASREIDADEGSDNKT